MLCIALSWQRRFYQHSWLWGNLTLHSYCWSQSMSTKKKMQPPGLLDHLLLEMPQAFHLAAITFSSESEVSLFSWTWTLKSSPQRLCWTSCHPYLPSSTSISIDWLVATHLAQQHLLLQELSRRSTNFGGHSYSSWRSMISPQSKPPQCDAWYCSHTALEYLRASYQAVSCPKATLSNYRHQDWPT